MMALVSLALRRPLLVTVLAVATLADADATT